MELAKLSVREPNLVAWSIDDFNQNLSFFTPQRMDKILGATRAIGPRLAFVPCLYFPGVTARFVHGYRGRFDGILFPYRHESAGANLHDASLVEAEVKKIKDLVGPSVPVIVDVYASGHSTLGSSTPEYVRQVMVAAKRCATASTSIATRTARARGKSIASSRSFFAVGPPPAKPGNRANSCRRPKPAANSRRNVRGSATPPQRLLALLRYIGSDGGDACGKRGQAPWR